MRKIELDNTKLFKDTGNATGTGLAGRFIFPPFSVLHASNEAWLRRKRQWIRLGIQSELGRDSELLIKDKNLKNLDVYREGAYKKAKTLDTKAGEKWEPGKGKPVWQNSGTSIFDPVVCELMYTWFCPKGGQIVDTFAGGSVRGIVAGKLGYRYWGCDLREEQITENIKQGQELVPDNVPVWVCGDSNVKLAEAPRADFIFSCPPYGNLEVYSDLEDDLSNKEFAEFNELYKQIIAKACKKLKRNRFACFVVSNYRDKKTGFYYDLVGATVRAFEEAGVMYYNEAILETAIGSLPFRTTKQFNAGRKLGKSHQNILVFYKGDPKEIKETFGEV